MSRRFTPDPSSQKEDNSEFNRDSEVQKSKLPTINISLDKLPSKGISYPNGASISYRPYTILELKKASESKMTDKQMFEFISNGIFVEGMDFNELTLGDANYLALYRKLSTYGKDQKFIAKQKCGGCGENNELEIEVAKIGPNFINAPDLPMYLNLGGNNYGFKPITISKYFELSNMVENNDDIDPDYAAFAMMCSTHTFDEIYAELENIYREEDMETLENIDTYLSHGLKPHRMKCKNADKKGDEKCDYVTNVRLDGGQAVLLPFRSTKRDTRNKVSFGSV